MRWVRVLWVLTVVLLAPTADVGVGGARYNRTIGVLYDSTYLRANDGVVALIQCAAKVRHLLWNFGKWEFPLVSHFRFFGRGGGKVSQKCVPGKCQTLQVAQCGMQRGGPSVSTHEHERVRAAARARMLCCCRAETDGVGTSGRRRAPTVRASRVRSAPRAAARVAPT